MKALPKRKGNELVAERSTRIRLASMKALPKRKGNPVNVPPGDTDHGSLNESPSQKEGKFAL